jgi:hypothetical protein
MKRLTYLMAGGLVAAVAVAWLVGTALPGGTNSEPGPSESFVPSQKPGKVVGVSGYRLSGPYKHDNLAVYLVHGPEILDGTAFFTLQEGLANQRAVVHETGTVGEVAVENTSPGNELFISAGDIVKGGKQDRTLPYDTVVGPHTGRISINSFCVEQGRWTKREAESTEYFSSSSSNLSTNALKRAAYSPGESSQAAVWDNVSQTQAKLSAKAGVSVAGESSKSSLQLTLENPTVRAALEPYQKALAKITDNPPDVIGCVVTANGWVISADVYAAAGLFRKLWPKLLTAGAVEAFLADGPATAPPTDEEVLMFLADLETASPASEAVTERTYVLARRADAGILIVSCDRGRANLVLHRSFLAK